MTSKEKKVENFPQVQAGKIATKEEEYSKQIGETSKNDEKGKTQTS
jgi:hypothetical protein